MKLFDRLLGRRNKPPWPPPKNPELEQLVERAVADVRAWLTAELPDAEVWWHGAIHIHPRYIAVWVKTDTDAQRDALIAGGLRERVHDDFHKAGYPAEVVPEVAVACESDETVKRDWNGSWWYRIK